jgi:hypothetical protein
MGLQVEIVERSSVIVMTLTGLTDIGELEPLHDALHVAASEGQAVVLDLTGLSRASPGTEIIDALGPAAATLKLVARFPTGSAQPPVPGAEVYPSVDAAIAAIRNSSSPSGEPTGADLARQIRRPLRPVRPHDRPLPTAAVPRRETSLRRNHASQQYASIWAAVPSGVEGTES